MKINRVRRPILTLTEEELSDFLNTRGANKKAMIQYLQEFQAYEHSFEARMALKAFRDKENIDPLTYRTILKIINFAEVKASLSVEYTS